MSAGLAAAAGAPGEVEIVLRSGVPDARRATLPLPAPPAPQPEPSSAPAPTTEAASSALVDAARLDPRLTFATFHTGVSNGLAYRAATLVGDGMLGATPLVIHGGVGLGKTHLLQAIAHRARSRQARALYLTCERFMHAVVSAMRAQRLHALTEALGRAELLLVDDAQFIQGRVATQVLSHVLDRMVAAGRPLVVATDRAPAELDHFDEQLRSRLAGGVATRIGAPDEAVRLGIVRQQLAASAAANPAFAVDAEVTGFIVRSVATNGRDLQGAVNRLMAHAALGAAPLDLAAAETAIADLVRQHAPPAVRVDDCLKAVVAHYGTSRTDILSSRRTASVVRPRQIAMYLAKVLTTRSLPEIGRRFGGRDHTTVLHAVRKIAQLKETDPGLAAELETLAAMARGMA
jgi:chromosomal replication initiator protein